LGGPPYVERDGLSTHQN